VVFKGENAPDKSFITIEVKPIREKLYELQPRHPLPVKEKADISVGLSSEALLAHENCK